MGKFSQRYKTDKNLSENGVEVDFGDGVKVVLRRINSEKSKEVRRRLERPFQRMIRSNSLPDAKQEEITREQIAEAVIVSWEGVEDNQGNLIPYSKQNALKVFEWYPDFLNDIITAITERDTFKNEDREEDAKNS